MRLLTIEDPTHTWEFLDSQTCARWRARFKITRADVEPPVPAPAPPPVPALPDLVSIAERAVQAVSTAHADVESLVRIAETHAEHPLLSVKARKDALVHSWHVTETLDALAAQTAETLHQLSLATPRLEAVVRVRVDEVAAWLDSEMEGAETSEATSIDAASDGSLGISLAGIADGSV